MLVIDGQVYALPLLGARFIPSHDEHVGDEVKLDVTQLVLDEDFDEEGTPVIKLHLAPADPKDPTA